MAGVDLLDSTTSQERVPSYTKNIAQSLVGKKLAFKGYFGDGISERCS